MITDIFSASVPAGKKSNETLNLLDIKEAGINKVGSIEVYMYIYDDDTYERISDLGHAEIKTNLYDAMDGANGDGIEYLSKDGIRVVGKYLNEDDFWGKSVVLYIENNTDEEIKLSVEDLSVNDFAIMDIDQFNVLPGKKLVDSITLFSSELEENGIETVEKIEFKLKSIDPKTYREIFTTDVITVIPQ